jgi:O-antigen/teichoic acid export membrane protein
MTGILFTLLVGSVDVLDFWLQNNILSYQINTMLILISLGNFASCLNLILINLSHALGNTRTSNKINTLMMLCGVPVLFYAVPMWEGEGAATIWAVIAFTQLILMIYFFRGLKLIGRAKWVASDVVLPFIATFFISMLFYKFTAWGKICLRPNENLS